MVNEQDTHTWISFKFRVFLFPTFVYCYRFTSMLQFSFAYSARQRLFLMFFIEIFALEIGARVPKTNPLTHALRLTVAFTTPHHIQRHDTARHGTARHGTARHGTVDATRCDKLRLCTLLTTLTKLHLTALHCLPLHYNNLHHTKVLKHNASLPKK